jgi:hypothetical protein
VGVPHRPGRGRSHGRLQGLGDGRLPAPVREVLAERRRPSTSSWSSRPTGRPAGGSCPPRRRPPTTGRRSTSGPPATAATSASGT